MKQPLLSVIVPVYNARPYLDECVKSILSQTYRNIELILINDGSTDGSGIRCDYWSEQDSRVTVIHQKNKGQAAARNCGLTHATGEYLWFIDSDDYITPPTLFESLIPMMVSEKYSFIQIPFIKADIRYNENDNVCVSDKYEMYSLWINGKRITNYLWDKIWARDIFNYLRFKEGIIFEDRYIFPDVLNSCNSAFLTNRGGYFYRTWPGQTTGRKRDAFFLKSMLDADLHILEEMPKQYSSLRKIVQKRMFSTFVELSQIEMNYVLTRSVYKSLSITNLSSIRMAFLRIFGPKGYIFISRFK